MLPTLSRLGVTSAVALSAMSFGHGASAATLASCSAFEFVFFPTADQIAACHTGTGTPAEAANAVEADETQGTVKLKADFGAGPDTNYGWAWVSETFEVSGLTPNSTDNSIVMDLALDGSLSADFAGDLVAFIGIGPDFFTAHDAALLRFNVTGGTTATAALTSSFSTGIVPWTDAGTPVLSTPDISGLAVNEARLSVETLLDADADGNATGSLDYWLYANLSAGSADFFSTGTLEANSLPTGSILTIGNGDQSFTANPAPVPLPASGWLMVAGGVALLRRTRT